MHTKIIFYLSLLLLFGSMTSDLNAMPTSTNYRIVETLDELPFKEVTDMIYDSDGLLWIATRNGLYCYNGSSLRPYRRDGQHPDMISGNEVKRIAEDHQRRIWIASAQGLDRLDKRTGIIEHLQPEGIVVADATELVVTRNGHVWIATTAAFLDYNPETEQFRTIVPDAMINRRDSKRDLPVVGAECIMEDHRGYIWLGTWMNGLYRYNPKEDEMIHYPQMNQQNSAHVIIEDDQKRIWIAGWGAGVHILNNAWDANNVSWQTFTTPDLIGRFTYCMTLDEEHHQILIGSSRGLTIADTEHLGTFDKVTDPNDGHALPGGEITGIERSRDGLFWVSMIGDGVAAIEAEELRFGRSVMSSQLPHLKVSSVRSIFADRENRLWLGIGTQGLAVRDLQTHQLYNWNEIPALANTHEYMSTVYAITETFDRHIWVATYGGELIDIVPPAAGEDIRRLSATCYKAGVSDLTPSERIFTLFEDHNDNLWIGGLNGVVIRHPDGSYERLDSLTVAPNQTMSQLDIRDIAQAEDGAIWMVALHSGIYRLQQKEGSWEASFFNTSNEGVADNELQCICIDHHGAIWAGSNYGDLYYYDKESNRFISVKNAWNLPGASIAFISNHPEYSKTDDSHKLWVGTNAGLLYIDARGDLSGAQVSHYSRHDGMLDNQLIRNAVTADPAGRFYIGTYKGYNDFDPVALANERHKPEQAAIGQIYINDMPWELYPTEIRNAISPLAPRYTHSITLQGDQNDLRLDFIQTFTLQQKDRNYAYKLEGYDSEWRYTWGAQPRAYYSNLPAGNYQLHVYASKKNNPLGNDEPVADEDMLVIDIQIMPQWYATLWAKILYVILGVLALFLIYRGVRSLKSYWKRLLVLARDRAAMRKGDIIIKTNKIEVTNQDKDFITHAIACIEEHISDADYDQQRFLDDMGVSKATCFRKLKSITGQSYSTFVRDIKMKAALRIQQKNPDIRISDLAYAIGFSDPKYFSSCFKKYYGKLPSEMVSNENGEQSV